MARAIPARKADGGAETTWSRVAKTVALLALGLFTVAAFRPPAPPAAEPLPHARSVVFVVPHEDDESLFAGEVIARYERAGAHVKLVYGTTSAGGRIAAARPRYRTLRRRALEEVLRALPGVTATVAPIPDGGGLSVDRKELRLAEFLRLPGMIPRDATVFVIAGDGNSDHVDARQDVLALMARRRRPVYLYWGYGRDHGRLDPAIVGVPVAFTPDARERALKRWAVGVYDRVVYRTGAFSAYRPSIMDDVMDDVVTLVRPRVPPAAAPAGQPVRSP